MKLEYTSEQLYLQASLLPRDPPTSPAAPSPPPFSLPPLPRLAPLKLRVGAPRLRELPSPRPALSGTLDAGQASESSPSFRGPRLSSPSLFYSRPRVPRRHSLHASAERAARASHTAVTRSLVSVALPAVLRDGARYLRLTGRGRRGVQMLYLQRLFDVRHAQKKVRARHPARAGPQAGGVALIRASLR